MTTPTENPLRKLERLDEDFTSLCADVRDIKRVQQGHGAKLNQLQSDVTSLKSDVGVLMTDVGVLKTDVGALKSDMSELRTDVMGKLDVIISRLPER